MKTEHFECACYSPEHTLKFILNTEENELYCYFFLSNYDNIFKKIWVAIKYVFGYKCQYGHWDEWIMQPQDVDKMINMLQKFKNDNE